jgi:WD40 repeat protein
MKSGLLVLAWMFVLSVAGLARADERVEVFLQTGHVGSVSAVAVSPDGRLALSGGDDHTLKLWEIATGREVRTFKGHTKGVCAVAFSPDGQWVLSGGQLYDDNLKLWELATGREVRTFSGHTNAVCTVAFSPDGRWVLSGGHGTDPTLRMWDVTTGQEIRRFSEHKESVTSAVISTDGKWVLSGSYDQTLKLWEVATGREVRTFRGHEGGVSSVALSPDGRWALSGSHDRSMKLWEVGTGREMRTFNGRAGGSITAVAFSPDGRRAISGGYLNQPIKLWDVATGKIVRTFQSNGQTVNSVAFVPNDHWILAGYEDESGGVALKLFDTRDGKKVRDFHGIQTAVTSVAFSPDARWLVSGSEDRMLKLWELPTGRMVRSLDEHKKGVTSVAFSPDARWIASSSHDVTVKLWDVSTGRVSHTFPGATWGESPVAFSPNSKFLIAGNSDPEGKVQRLKLWDLATRREVHSFEPPLSSIAFSPDGQFLLGGGFFHKWLHLWEVGTGREVRRFIEKGRNYDLDVMSPVAYSPNGQLVLGTRLGDLKLFDTNTGNLVRTLETGTREWVKSVAFSPDGRWLLAGGDDHVLRLWEVATGREVLTLLGHFAGVTSVAFSQNGNLAVSGGRDGMMKLWRVADGIELVTMMGFGDGEWIALTPDGYYAASPKGDTHLNVRLGNQVYGIDQFRSTFYRPEIVEATLRLGNREEAIAKFFGEKDGRTPNRMGDFVAPPTVVISSPEDRTVLSRGKLDLAISVADKNYFIQSVRVSRNGAQVWPIQTRDLVVTAKSGAEKASVVPVAVPTGVREWIATIPLDLEEGENVIEVKAFNGHSETVKAITVSLPASLVPHDDVIKPNLWILSIGINAYQDRQIRALSYAEADAQAIVQAFTQQRGKLFRDVRSLIISDSSTMKPTYDTILDNLGYLRQAGQNDVVLLFLAGHGINDDRGEFYFLPSDAAIQSDGSIKRSRAISNDEIKKVLDLPAKKIVFLDACHSEGVSKKKTRGVDNNRFIKELQAMDAVILTSSAGNELSQEGDDWKHGAFTYALLEGLSGKADLITKDGIVSMKELDGYVSERVPHLTNGAQHPITDTPGGYRNFPVALLR